MAKSADYYEGVRHAEARIRARDAARASGSFATDAADVAKHLRRDEATKQRILARSPQIAYGLDAMELAGMSSIELATRELERLGLKPGDEPVMALDMYHLGRQHGGAARGQVGGFSSALDGSENGGDDFVSHYIDGK